MARRKIVAVCQCGGKFVSNTDGCLTYTGGEAHAIEVDREMRFDEFKSEVAEVWQYDKCGLSFKYFLPHNKRSLITVSCDKDLQRMVDFHEGSVTIDVYVLASEVAAHNVSNIVDNCASRTRSRRTVVKSVIPGATTGAAADDVTASSTVGAASDHSMQHRPRDPVTPGATIGSASDHVREHMLSYPVTSGAAPDYGSQHWHSDPATPTSTVGDAADPIRQQKLSDSWDNIITGVGQEFDSAQDFREALCKYAIAKCFMYELIKNEKDRVTAKCKAKSCPWRVHASKLPTVQKLMIKTINNVHTCGGDIVTKGQRQTHATVRLIANIIKDKIRDNPHYTPSEIVTDLHRDYGINLNYSQAWRGKEIAKEQLKGSQIEAYNELPSLCERIMETNPGSLATLITIDDSRFHRLFVSFHASKHGFERGCCPLLFLSRISLNEYLGILLVATAVDGDGGIFPVAFAVAEVENYDSWHWFLVQLKSLVSTAQTITFVSSKGNDLNEAVSQVFEGSHHAYCLHHLIEKFKDDFKGLQRLKDIVVDKLKYAAHACTVRDFNSCIKSIKQISPDAAAWILASETEQWSNAFFRGSRYDHLSLNIADLFKGWMSEETEVSISIVQTIHLIQRRMMEMIYTRQEASNTWSTTLTPSMEEKLQEEISKSHSFNVFSSTDFVFEVRDDTSADIVNIEILECTCRRWQITGLPCMHATAVFNHTGRNAYEYSSNYFTVTCYRLTYSESINPVPDLPGESKPVTVLHPPPVRCPPRRPKSKRTKTQEIKRRPICCSKCGRLGHNKLTCKFPKQ